jgi:hypothetical protein
MIQYLIIRLFSVWTLTKNALGVLFEIHWGSAEGRGALSDMVVDSGGSVKSD